MSDTDKLKDLPKMLARILPYVDGDAKVRFELRKVGREWTVHNFKLEAVAPAPELLPGEAS